MTINSLTRNDAGLYHVIVRNEGGQAMQHFDVEVFGE